MNADRRGYAQILGRVSLFLHSPLRWLNRTPTEEIIELVNTTGPIGEHLRQSASICGPFS
jgi:hypothetical protein